MAYYELLKVLNIRRVSASFDVETLRCIVVVEALVGVFGHETSCGEVPNLELNLSNCFHSAPQTSLHLFLP